MTTEEFTPPAVSGFFPTSLWNFNAEPVGLPRGYTRPKHRAKIVYEDPEYTILFSRLDLEDFGGGLNMVRGNYEVDWDRIASGTAHIGYKTLCLPFLQESDATPDPGGTVVGVHSCNMDGVKYVAAGSSSGSALFKETSATDSSLVATDYAPPSPITGIFPIVIGGATQDERLMITHRNDPPKIVTVSGTTATVVGTMHSDLDNSMGAVQGFLYVDSTHTNPILIYANNGIYLMYQESGITDAPTKVLSGVPRGGYALGLVELGAAGIRAAFVWPHQDRSSGMLLDGGVEKPGKVVTVNLLGTDYQVEPVMGLATDPVYFAAIVNGSSIVGSDKRRVCLYTGRQGSRDLGWFAERPADSDYTHREIRGFAVNSSEIWASVNKVPFATGTNTVHQWESYDLETNAILPRSAETNVGTAFARSMACTPIAISDLTRAIHQYSSTQWKSIFVPYYGENPFHMYRKTSGAASGTGKTFESSASVTTCAMDIPGLEGWPSVPSRVLFMGQIQDASDNTTRGKVTVDWANWQGDFTTAGTYLSAVFLAGRDGRHQASHAPIHDRNYFYKFQVKITIDQGSGGTDPTRYTSNALPLGFEFFTKVKTAEFDFEYLRQLDVLR